MGCSVRFRKFPLILLLLATTSFAGQIRPDVILPELPDTEIMKAYEKAAVQNVLAAINPKIFFGYWSVCADGQGFGYGYTYPSLDGHQMTDALLWLGQVDIVKANFDYVRSFQREDGSLPIAILPDLAGKKAGEGNHLAPVASNGGLYEHWVPGNPLAALADPTYIQNADDIFRHTLDQNWLKAQLPSVNLAADHLASLIDDKGAVKGSGYYIERPTRIESDGVAQCHAVDAFWRVAALNRLVGDEAKAKKYEQIAERIRQHFVTFFWVKDHFAEYFNPQHGLIANHGLTDVDWAAIALNMATPDQQAHLWPQLKDEKSFYYGGMPTGIATKPETYEDWEFSHPDRHDLAAMGRVWYLEAQARARMGGAQGLLWGIRKVCEVGRNNGYYWRERYQPDGKGGVVPAGPNTYCEYPANLIRIIQRFLLGVDFRLDGSLVLAPMVTEEFWKQGFGQTLRWRDRALQYRMQLDRITGTYSGGTPQILGVRLPSGAERAKVCVTIEDSSSPGVQEGDLILITLPSALPQKPCRFAIVLRSNK
jgi:hypothetical protein